MKFSFALMTLLGSTAAEENTFAQQIAQNLMKDQKFQQVLTNQIQENMPAGNMEDFNKLTLQDKLKSISKDLKSADQLSALWDGVKDTNNQHLSQFNVNFNSETNAIDIHSTAVDTEGLPLYQWHQAQDGTVKSTIRDATEEKQAPVKEEQPATPVETEAPKTEAKPETVEKKAPSTLQTVTTSGFEAGYQIDSKTYLTPEEIEMQRDVAFKIVYFFIAFIIMTFGLLYAYYKVDQKEQEREQREKRTKGIFFEEPNQKSFFDFLAGNLDEENYLVNPNARK